MSCQDAESRIMYPVPKVLALSPALSLTLNNVTDLKGMQVMNGWQFLSLSDPPRT